MLRWLFAGLFDEFPMTIGLLAFAVNLYCAWHFWSTWPAIWSDPSGFYTHEQQLQEMREYLLASVVATLICIILVDEGWIIHYVCAAFLVIQGGVLAIAALMILTIVGGLVVIGHASFLELIGWSVASGVLILVFCYVTFSIKEWLAHRKADRLRGRR